MRGVTPTDFQSAKDSHWSIPLGKASECKYDEKACTSEMALVRVFSMSTAPNAIQDMGQNFKNIHYILSMMKKIGMPVKGMGHVVGCGGRLK